MQTGILSFEKIKHDSATEICDMDKFAFNQGRPL